MQDGIAQVQRWQLSWPGCGPPPRCCPWLVQPAARTLVRPVTKVDLYDMCAESKSLHCIADAWRAPCQVRHSCLACILACLARSSQLLWLAPSSAGKQARLGLQQGGPAQRQGAQVLIGQALGSRGTPEAGLDEVPSIRLAPAASGGRAQHARAPRLAVQAHVPHAGSRLGDRLSDAGHQLALHDKPTLRARLACVRKPGVVTHIQLAPVKCRKKGM